MPAIRRGARRQSPLLETRFPREDCLGLAGQLGSVFDSALSVFGEKEGCTLMRQSRSLNVGCFGLVGQACLKRLDRSDPRRQAQPDWNGGPSIKRNDAIWATAFRTTILHFFVFYARFSCSHLRKSFYINS